jgi:hypothetical protein
MAIVIALIAFLIVVLFLFRSRPQSDWLQNRRERTRRRKREQPHPEQPIDPTFQFDQSSSDTGKDDKIP